MKVEIDNDNREKNILNANFDQLTANYDNLLEQNKIQNEFLVLIFIIKMKYYKMSVLLLYFIFILENFNS